LTWAGRTGTAHWHCPNWWLVPPQYSLQHRLSSAQRCWDTDASKNAHLGNKWQRTAPEVGRQPNWLGGCLETSRVRDLSCGTALIKPKNQLRNLHRFHRSNAVPTQPRQPMNMTCAADRCFIQRESWFAAVSLDFSGQVKPWRRTNPVRQKTTIRDQVGIICGWFLRSARSAVASELLPSKYASKHPSTVGVPLEPGTNLS